MSKTVKYLLFTFITAYTLQIIGSHDFDLGTSAGLLTFSSATSLCMFMPTLGVLFARGGIRKMGWRPNIKENKKEYLFAWLMPTAFTVLGAALYYMVFPEDLDTTGAVLSEMDPAAFKNIENGGSLTWYIIKEIFYSLTSFYTCLGVIFGLGEEIGWRGFMYPELKQRFGRVRGVLLGGVIHGAWHFPLMLLVGYEYGKDYIGTPALGLFAFCIFTVSTGIISDHLYEKTHCIWLPGLIHGTVNATVNPYILRADTHHRRTIFGPAEIGLISVIPIVFCAAAILYFDVKRDNMELEDTELW